MKNLLMLAMLFLLVVSCAGKVPTPRPMPDFSRIAPAQPVLRRECHGDVAFTPEERLHLENAALAWRLESQGVSDLSIVWDVDVDSVVTMEELQRTINECLILKVDQYASVVQMADARHPGFRCLGITLDTGEPNPHVYFPMDRIPSSYLVWIAMHEFGHALGLDDLATDGDIMSSAGHIRTAWFTERDHAECARVGACR